MSQATWCSKERLLSLEEALGHFSTLFLVLRLRGGSGTTHDTRFQSQHVTTTTTSPPQPRCNKTKTYWVLWVWSYSLSHGLFCRILAFWQWRKRLKSSPLTDQMDWYIWLWQYYHRYELNAGCARTVHASYVSYNRDYDCEFVPTFWKPPFSYTQHSITWRVRNVNQPMETCWNHHATGLLYLRAQLPWRNKQTWVKENQSHGAIVLISLTLVTLFVL